MPFIWLPHARERLQERGLSETLVLGVLHEPQQVVGYGAHKVCQSRYVDPRRKKEYLLRVFIEVHRDLTMIQSAYRTSKIDKYWRNP